MAGKPKWLGWNVNNGNVEISENNVGTDLNLKLVHARVPSLAGTAVENRTQVWKSLG